MPRDQASRITYGGKDHNGIARGGSATGSPAKLIGRLFRQGWPWAIAERDGTEVGGISFDENTGRAVWWAES